MPPPHKKSKRSARPKGDAATSHIERYACDLLSVKPGTSVKYEHILQLYYECNCSIAATVKKCEGVFNAETLEGINVILRVRHISDIFKKKFYSQASSPKGLNQLKEYCENEFAVIIAAACEQLNMVPVLQSTDNHKDMDTQQTLPSLPTHTDTFTATATSPAPATSLATATLPATDTSPTKSHCVPRGIFTPTKTHEDVYHSASTSTTLRRQLSKYL